MAKYLDPKVDLAFKRVFGEHKPLLISFLNALLPLENDAQIISLEYLPPEQTPEVIGFLKNSIVDVKCTDQKDRVFIVEMQMLWSQAFNKRIVYNSAKAYVNQLKQGEDYIKLNPVYMLALINQNMDKDDEFYHHYKMCNINNQNKTLTGIEIIVIELKKFKPEDIKAKRIMILWLRFLNEIGETDFQPDSEMLAEKNIATALNLVEIAAFTEAELNAYDLYLDRIRVQRALMLDSHKEGEAKGKAEGIIEGEAKGIEKTTLNMIKKMQSKGKNIQEISELLDLTIEEIQHYLSK